MNHHGHITKHIDDLPSGPKIAALFDFDGTIIDGFSAFVFIREQLKSGYMSPVQFVEIVATLVNYSMGNTTFPGMMDVGAKLLNGVSEDNYIEFSESVFEEHIAKLLYPEAKALIEAHKAKGHTVAIISSAPNYQVEPLAEELGIEHVLCSLYEVENGTFTGKAVHPTCWGEGKVIAAQKLAKKLKLHLSKSCFYTDSDDDLELLEKVGHPRIVNPNEKLHTIASQKGWPVQQFAPTKKPKFSEYVRSLGVYATLLGSYFGGMGVWKLNGSKDEGRRFMLSLFTDIAFALIGVRLKVRGQENLWKMQPGVVIFNHQSQADGLVMMKLLRDNFAAIGKKEIGKLKLFAMAYEFAGVITIDRKDTQSAIEAMQPLVDTLAIEGRNVVIAPEGTRSETRMPGSFKKGAFHVAMQAKAPVIPVVIHNAIDIQPKGQFAYRPGTIEVEILPPVDTSDWTKENMSERIEAIRNQYLETLGYEAETTIDTKEKSA